MILYEVSEDPRTKSKKWLFLILNNKTQMWEKIRKVGSLSILEYWFIKVTYFTEDWAIQMWVIERCQIADKWIAYWWSFINALGKAMHCADDNNCAKILIAFELEVRDYIWKFFTTKDIKPIEKYTSLIDTRPF